MMRGCTQLLFSICVWWWGTGWVFGLPTMSEYPSSHSGSPDCVRLSQRGNTSVTSPCLHQQPKKGMGGIQRQARPRSWKNIDLSIRVWPRLWEDAKFDQPHDVQKSKSHARNRRRLAWVAPSKPGRSGKQGQQAQQGLNTRLRLNKPRVSNKPDSGGLPQTSLQLPEGLPPRFDAGYGQTTLEQVLSIIRSNNLDLRILRERVVQSEIARAKAWAILKPQLALTGAYIRNEVEASFNNPLTGTDIIIMQQNQLNAQLQLKWAFFNLQAIPVLQIAYMAVDQVGQTAKQVNREILYAATRAYYGILLTDGLVDITRRSWEAAREHLRISIARYRAGVAPELVVTKAQLDLSVARQNWIQAQNGLRNARLAMALLLNRDLFPYRPLRPATPQLPAGEKEQWLQVAQQNRLELKVAQIAVDIAHKQITNAWMAFVPTVAVVGALAATNAAGFTGQNTQWSVTLAATMNLYSGGTRYLDIKEAHSKYRQARLEFAKNRRQVINEILQSDIAIKNARIALQVAQEQVALTQRSYQLTQERYKTGVATPVEVSDALTALRSAEITMLRETLNQELAILGLLKALGLYPSKP